MIVSKDEILKLMLSFDPNPAVQQDSNLHRDYIWAIDIALSMVERGKQYPEAIAALARHLLEFKFSGLAPGAIPTVRNSLGQSDHNFWAKSKWGLMYKAMPNRRPVSRLYVQ